MTRLLYNLANIFPALRSNHQGIIINWLNSFPIRQAVHAEVTESFSHEICMIENEFGQLFINYIIIY